MKSVISEFKFNGLKRIIHTCILVFVPNLQMDFTPSVEQVYKYKIL